MQLPENQQQFVKKNYCERRFPKSGGFEKATGVKVNWEYAPRREGDIEQVWGNVDKANKVLGWKADTPTDEVLKSAWRWQEKLRKDGIQ